MQAVEHEVPVFCLKALKACFHKRFRGKTEAGETGCDWLRSRHKCKNMYRAAGRKDSARSRAESFQSGDAAQNGEVAQLVRASDS